MGRIHYTLTDNQAKKMREHCRRISWRLRESPGFVFKRACFCLNSLFDTGIDIDSLRDGCELIKGLHEHGCCLGLARKKIREISELIKKKS